MVVYGKSNRQVTILEFGRQLTSSLGFPNPTGLHVQTIVVQLFLMVKYQFEVNNLRLHQIHRNDQDQHLDVHCIQHKRNQMGDLLLIVSSCILLRSITRGMS